MEDLEALVLDALYSVSLDVVLQEFKAGSVGLDWVAKVVLVHRLLVVPQETADCLDAGG